MTAIALVLTLTITVLSACTAGAGRQTTLPSPTSPPTVTALPSGWYTDAEKETADPQGEHAWVAAWFADENVMPDSVSRRWRPLDGTVDDTPAALLERSVDLLDEPPPDRTSAFAGGIDVHDVTVDDGQVLLDLDADSPGLYGHGSTGLLIGIEQLAAATAFYFPEAQTLCVAYDGQPTSVEDGGPIFLHDASGCPILLR